MTDFLRYKLIKASFIGNQDIQRPLDLMVCDELKNVFGIFGVVLVQALWGRMFTSPIPKHHMALDN